MLAAQHQKLNDKETKFDNQAQTDEYPEPVETVETQCLTDGSSGRVETIENEIWTVIHPEPIQTTKQEVQTEIEQFKTVERETQTVPDELSFQDEAYSRSDTTPTGEIAVYHKSLGSKVSQRHIRAQSTNQVIQQQLEQLDAANTTRDGAKKKEKAEDTDFEDCHTLAQQTFGELTIQDTCCVSCNLQ